MVNLFKKDKQQKTKYFLQINSFNLWLKIDQQLFYMQLIKYIPINFTMYSIPVTTAFLTPNQLSPRSSYLNNSDQKRLADSVQIKSSTSMYTTQIGMENKYKTPQKTDRSETLCQNFALIEENKALRKQLSIYKGQSGLWTADSSIHQAQQSRVFTFNWKQTSKKQDQQLNQLRNWTEVLRKQCKKYQDIINRMDQKISGLQSSNRQLQAQIKKYKVQKQDRQNQYQLQKLEMIASFASKEKQIIKQLKEKTNSIMEMYGRLQADSNQSQIQWTIWKNKWEREKSKYLEKIANLQEIVYNLRHIQKRQTKIQNNKAYKQLFTDRQRSTSFIEDSTKNLKNRSSYYEKQYRKRY